MLTSAVEYLMRNLLCTIPADGVHSPAPTASVYFDRCAHITSNPKIRKMRGSARNGLSEAQCPTKCFEVINGRRSSSKATRRKGGHESETKKSVRRYPTSVGGDLCYCPGAG